MHPLIKLLQWVLIVQAKKYVKFAAHIACTYLASVVTSTWLYTSLNIHILSFPAGENTGMVSQGEVAIFSDVHAHHV